MLLTIKPLKGDNILVEMEEDASIGDLKKKIEAQKADFPAESLKLIYKGKVLQDGATIKASEVKPEDFIVCMVTKAAAPAAAAPAAAPEPAAPAAPAAAPAAAAPAAAPALPSVITDLKNYPDYHTLAVVVTRQPAVLTRMLPALQARYPELLQAIQGNLEGFVAMLREEAGAEGAAGGGPGGGMPGGGMPGNVQAMAQMLAQNPQMLQQLAQSDPQLAAAMQQNPQAVAQALAMASQGGMPGMGGGMGGGMPQQIQLSEADQAAVDRLVALGFDKEMVIEVYLGCGKDEQLAATILLDEQS